VNDFYLLLLSCVAIGVGSSIYLPAAKSFLVKHTSEHMRVDVLSLRVVFSNIGVAIGPVIGLVVFEMSPYILFSLVGIIFAILLIMNGLLTDCPRSKHTRELKALDLLRLSTNIKMLIIAISTFIFMAMYMQIEVTVPLLAKELYDKSTVSAIFVINAAVVVLLQVYVSRWACDMRNNNPIAIGFLLFSISFFLLDLSSYGQSIVFLSVIFFTLAEIIFQIRLDYETTLVNEKMVASSFGLMSLAAAFGGLFGSYAGSLLYQSDLKGISFWEWLCYFTLILSIIYFVKSYAKGFNYEASCNDKPS
jgi:MFS family permease